MTILIAFAVALALGSDLGTQAPAKPPSVAEPNIPSLQRQGGDTVWDAFPIPALPYFDTGTTTGYTDDYEEVCPVGGISPDVVYFYEPATNQQIDVDLCGSSYDTKTYIYDGGFDLIACNDDYYQFDFCGIYRSRIVGAPLLGGGRYYIVVDGYFNDYGEYDFAVTMHEPCELPCPAGGVPEGEPPLPGDLTDEWNGGCATSESTPPLQSIAGNGNGEAVLCGVSGWRSANLRDTDWFTLAMGPAGTISVTVDAEVATHVFELRPQDCAAVEAVGHIAVECGPVTLMVSGYEPGDTVWLWIGPAFYSRPNWAAAEYDYVVWLSGLEPAVATETATWSGLKALYRRR